MTEAERVAWVTARLMGRTIVENISNERGYAAMRITLENGTVRIDTPKSDSEWSEWLVNVRRSQEAGYCFYVDYDSKL